MDVRSYVRRLPKAELHMHLEGSLEPEMLMRLATRNKVEIPFRTVEAIRDAYHFTELQDFLDIYYQGMNVLRAEEELLRPDHGLPGTRRRRRYGSRRSVLRTRRDTPLAVSRSRP